MVKDHSDSKSGNLLLPLLHHYLNENQDFIGIALSERKEGFYLTMHSTHSVI